MIGSSSQNSQASERGKTMICNGLYYEEFLQADAQNIWYL